VISRAGKWLDKLCKPEFTFVDATKFSSWKIGEAEVHAGNPMKVRILARLVSYQMKLIIRCTSGRIEVQILILRHSQDSLKYL